MHRGLRRPGAAPDQGGPLRQRSSGPTTRGGACRAGPPGRVHDSTRPADRPRLAAGSGVEGARADHDNRPECYRRGRGLAPVATPQHKRHSFCTERVAATQDVPRTALEAGNSGHDLRALPCAGYRGGRQGGVHRWWSLLELPGGFSSHTHRARRSVGLAPELDVHRVGVEEHAGLPSHLPHGVVSPGVVVVTVA